ncbi:MAG: hypothetical protein ACFE9R_14225 [Candidatus Hermodarchaeota archaeon]
MQNPISEVGSKDIPIYVKVDESTRKIIDKYKNLGKTISNLIKDSVEIYDDYNSMSPDVKAIIDTYKEKDEKLIKFLERAVQYYGQHKNLDRDLWVRARDEMKMMLIGKTTFNQLIAAAEAPETALEKPFKKNVAYDLILWYTGKPLKNLTIDDLINTIAKLWVVANYFYQIDVNREGDEYHLLFKHRQNKRYSRYWLGYFTEVFLAEDLNFKCIIEGQAFEETLSMTIKVEEKELK